MVGLGRRSLILPSLGCEDAQSARILLMKISFGNKFFMLPVRAMWPVMRRFSFNRMFTASLASSECAGVITTIYASFMEKSAIRHSVLNSIKLIHLLPIVFTAEIAKGGLGVARLRGTSCSLRDAS